MYAKLFSRITESSLMEEDILTRYTFMMLLAIADPHGAIIGTDVALARRLNMALADFQTAIEHLMAPDPNSNSPAEEGRRVVRSDGERGYKLVNFLHYRSIRDEEHRRAFMRQYISDYRQSGRDKSRPVKPVNNGKLGKLGLAQAEAEAEEEEKTIPSAKAKGAVPSGDHQHAIKLWCSFYKKLVGEDYVVTAKDGAAVKALLKAGLTPEGIIDLARKARSLGDPFLAKQAVTLAGLRGSLNPIRAALATPSGSGSLPIKPSKGADEMISSLERDYLTKHGGKP